MKKILKLLTIPVLALSTLGIVSCNNNSTPTPTINGGEDIGDADLVLYFYRFDENYSDVGAWIWGSGNAAGIMFDSAKTVKFAETGDWNWLQVAIEFDKEYTVYTDWNFSVETTITMTEDQWSNIIIRNKAGSKDIDADRTLDLSQKDDDGVIRIYSITQNENFFYDISDVPTSPISDVYFIDTKQIRVGLYYALTDVALSDFKVVDAENKNYPLTNLVKGNSINLILQDTYTDYTKPLYLNYKTDKYTISYRGVYKSDSFNQEYEYTGKDLGAVVSTDNSSTTFKLWSPSATEVKVNFYDSATSTGIKESFNLTKGEKGVWSYTAARDLHGQYYTYTVTVLGKTNNEVADPYASSSNANGQRSLVVNWSKISTSLTSTAPTVTTPSSVSVLEMHVRDVTVHESWNGTAANKGKYLGLIESGTKLGTGEATGFDYIKSLGVSHVQLQPVYDFNSVDETKLNDASYQTARRNGIYNWGYDPYSYSSLEGSYSSDPNDGLTRINEFRQVTNAYNAAGIGVIMDVVYNHMPSGANSTYEKIMPDYYFRSNSYSGAGTDVASENAMVKNMIVQTTEQLTRRYNLAGFRFDLMGLITKSAMEEVDTNLRTFDDDVILYGEGWSMYNGDKYLGNETQGIQGAFKNAEESKESKIGFFNDTFRDGMKGNVFNEVDKGFLQGAYDGTSTTLSALRTNVNRGLYGTQTGITRWANFFSGVSVNYVEAHDNLTLHDKLYATNPEMSEEVRHNLQSFANDVVALSSGVSFYQLGQEFARSKEMPASWLTGENAVNEKYTKVGDGESARYFVNDSYNFSDEINAIDWNLIKTNEAMVNDFKSVISIRNSSDLEAIRPATYQNTTFTTLGATDIGVSTDDYAKIIGYSVATGDDTKLAIVFNFSSTASNITSGIETGSKKIILNGETVSSLPSSLPSLSYLVIAY